MKEAELSVIIPVYETPENLLRQSVDSALQCEAHGLEILLADDGNTGTLAGALDAIAGEYDCIRVLHLPHRGVSAARNAALAKARGRYITFLDADDVLNGKAVGEVLALCRKIEPQLVISRISRRMESQKKPSPRASKQTEGKNLQDRSIWEDSPALRRDLRVYYTTLRDSRFRTPDAWVNRAPHGRFVKRELALQCSMNEKLSFGEDVIWNFDLLNRAENLLVTDHMTYCYREHPLSATQKVREHFPAEVKQLLRYYKQEIATWPETDRKYFYTAAIEYFTIMMRVYVFAGDRENARSRFDEVFSDCGWKKVFSRCRFHTLNGRYLLTGVLGKYGGGTGLYLSGLFYDRLVRKTRFLLGGQSGST